MHRYGMRAKHCLKCGAVIGVAPQSEALAGRNSEYWNDSASCARMHGHPTEKITKKCLGLILSHKITYPDDSWDTWQEYAGPSHGLKFWFFYLYVKFTGEKVKNGRTGRYFNF